MRSDFVIGFRNLGRNKRRTVLALVGIAVAQMTLVWLSSFMNGYQTLIFQKLTGPMLGHIQIHAPGYRDDNAVERVMTNASDLRTQLLHMKHVEQASLRVYAPILAAAEELGHAGFVMGVDLRNEITPSGILFRSGVALPAGQEVLLGKTLADEMRITKGTTLALMGQAADGSIASGLFKVKGFLKSDVEHINKAGLVMDLSEAQELLAMPNQVHEFALHLDDVSSVPAVIAELKQTPAFASLDVADWKSLAPQIAAYLQISSTMNLIILILVFLTTAAGIANTMVMATFERKQEFGMLVALGCSPSRLIGILMLESIMLGILGVLIGSVLGVGIVWSEMHYGIWLLRLTGSAGVTLSLEGLDISWDILPVLKITDIGRGIIAVVVTSAIATLWPARKIIRLQPIEALRL